jgi:hypothetical protein
MKIKIFFMAVMATGLLLSSCGKEGPQGIPGPPGDSSAQGPAGEDGSVIYAGSGAPATSIGKDGDYYLDKSTGNLYGPKTANAWGTPLALRSGSGGTGTQGPQGPSGPQGAQGAKGNPGSQILNGSGAPAAGLGNSGDYYLDKTGYFLYGPKTANGWGTPVLLRGAQGPQGPAGPAGIPGSQIFSGTGAPASNLGINGDFYLDKNTGNFYGPKTSSGWGTPISLKGSGGTGTVGPQGPQGPSGPAGPAGPAGPRGPSGATGPQGPQGATGNTGAAGAAGAAGSQIYSGAGTPPGGVGKTGDYYIDTEHAVIYGPKTAGGWPATGLSLQVNSVITYEFDNKTAHNLPYNWSFTSQNQVYIWLPYNNAAAQTQGFTIPQDIIDHGVVLSYIRYYKFGYAMDTATSSSMSPWFQMPYSYTLTTGNYNTINITTMVGDDGFQITLNSNVGVIGLANDSIPSQIRIVLIPEGKLTTIQKVNPDLRSLSMQQVTDILEADKNKRVTNEGPAIAVSE